MADGQSLTEAELSAAKQALTDHRGPTFRTSKIEEDLDGTPFPVAWTAECRCGVVTDEYETHLLEVIGVAVKYAT